uniref:Uncharacterized protein n=1 Tax=candidate division WOR-3 bacterium TaxID=2052148 RepID=A0A7C4TCW2_UNCW3
MLWRARKLLGTLTLSAEKYGGLSLKKGEGGIPLKYVLKKYKIIFIFGLLMGIFLIGFIVYLNSHRQGIIETQEFFFPNAKYRVLIASQGSPFKKDLVTSLVQFLKEKPVNITVIDVTKLSTFDDSNWDAVVIIHTTERWQLQPDVRAFLNRAKDRTKIMLVTTSGSGRWKTKDYNVDILTSASRTQELSPLTQKVSDWINSRLK